MTPNDETLITAQVITDILTDLQTDQANTWYKGWDGTYQVWSVPDQATLLTLSSQFLGVPNTLERKNFQWAAACVGPCDATTIDALTKTLTLRASSPVPVTPAKLN